MFENSLRLVAECGLTFLHVFPYSRPAGHARRRGCRRCRNPDPGAGGTAAGRRRGGIARLSCRRVGRRRAVLVESPGFGRTEHAVAVRLADLALPPVASLRVSSPAAAEPASGMTGGGTGQGGLFRRLFVRLTADGGQPAPELAPEATPPVAPDTAAHCPGTAGTRAGPRRRQRRRSSRAGSTGCRAGHQIVAQLGTSPTESSPIEGSTRRCSTSWRRC